MLFWCIVDYVYIFRQVGFKIFCILYKHKAFYLCQSYYSVIIFRKLTIADYYLKFLDRWSEEFLFLSIRRLQVILFPFCLRFFYSCLWPPYNIDLVLKVSAILGGSLTLLDSENMTFTLLFFPKLEDSK